MLPQCGAGCAGANGTLGGVPIGAGGGRGRRNKARQMSELEPTPELPDDTPIREVQFPTRIKDALFAAGIKTVGEVRETSTKRYWRSPTSERPRSPQLRDLVGLPSTDGVRPRGKKPSGG